MIPYRKALIVPENEGIRFQNCSTESPYQTSEENGQASRPIELQNCKTESPNRISELSRREPIASRWCASLRGVIPEPVTPKSGDIQDWSSVALDCLLTIMRGSWRSRLSFHQYIEIYLIYKSWKLLHQVVISLSEIEIYNEIWSR